MVLLVPDAPHTYRMGGELCTDPERPFVLTTLRRKSLICDSEVERYVPATSIQSEGPFARAKMQESSLWVAVNGTGEGRSGREIGASIGAEGDGEQSAGHFARAKSKESSLGVAFN